MVVVAGVGVCVSEMMNEKGWIEERMDGREWMDEKR